MTGGVVFAFQWTTIVHWELAVLFSLSCALFSVSLGLVLGVFFDRQQETTGWITLLIVILVGAIFVEMIELDLPAGVESLLPWVPSMIVADLFRQSLISNSSLTTIWPRLTALSAISLSLLGLVAWKVRQLDR